MARGVSKRFRRSYVLWEEGQPPDCVVEVSSPDSRKKDRTKERELYAKLGVRECFLIDPVYENSHSEGRLQGFRLWGDHSVPMGPGEEAGATALAVAKRCRLFTRATSLGGVESLIEHRGTIEGPASPIPQDLLRLSVGIEHPQDLIADLEQALAG